MTERHAVFAANIKVQPIFGGAQMQHERSQRSVHGREGVFFQEIEYGDMPVLPEFCPLARFGIAAQLDIIDAAAPVHPPQSVSARPRRSDTDKA